MISVCPFCAAAKMEVHSLEVHPLIAGALGYLGTELCKLYSGESWFHNIVAIDNRFVSKRVNQLKNWNIKFYQGQILDKDFNAHDCL